VRVTIFDYGAGNLHSLAKAIERGGVNVDIETDPARAAETDALVLPGVGAFGSAAARLAAGRTAMRDAVARGLPTIGICLGMQLMFDASDEGDGEGLGLIAGRVSRLRATRVPQIGWNTVEDARDPLFDAAPLPIAYYANSFVCRPEDSSSVIAWSEHEEDRFPAAVRAGTAVGVQFHPEKSSSGGVRLLHAFLDEARHRAGARR
jgi:imidazole glycerol-phosphate synthase subunit HisH